MYNGFKKDHQSNIEPKVLLPLRSLPYQKLKSSYLFDFDSKYLNSL